MLLTAIAVSLLFAVPVTLAALWGSASWERTLLGGAIAAVAMIMLNWLVFYTTTPTTGFSQASFWYSLPLWFAELVAVSLVVAFFSLDWKDKNDLKPNWSTWTLSTIAAVAFVFVFVFGFGSVFTQERATQLAELVEVQEAALNEYPETDAEHILQVPEATANYKADQVLASGEQRNIGTTFKRGEAALQSVDDHLYYLYPLRPTGIRTSNRVDGISPGYIVVDAENPNVPATLRLDYTLRYYPHGQFSHKIERLLWSEGYNDDRVTDLTLEVDDEWNPYFTGSLDRVTFNTLSSIPKKLLVVDPQTGDIMEYGLDEIPPWVDRVYSKATVEQMIDWWGHWGAGPEEAPYRIAFENQANRFKVDESDDPVLVYTDSGHAMWQAVLTSYSKDTSAAYLALFDGRSNQVTLYSVDNLTLESKVREAILTTGENLKNLEPVHLTLHSLYGELTWVAPLIKAGGGDDSPAQGIALVPARNVSGSSVVLSESGLSEALTVYRQQVALGNNGTDPEEGAQTESAEAEVTSLSQVVEAGQTVFYFTLDNDTEHVYRAVATPNNLELPFIQIGNQVRVTYVDTGAARRDVGAYDDLALQVTP